MTKLQQICAGLLVGVMASWTSPALSDGLAAGYFIVAGSYPTRLRLENAANAARVEIAARRCGVRVYESGSGQLMGMKPGYTLQLVGAFRTEARARTALSILRPCVPDAFIKHTIMAETDEE